MTVTPWSSKATFIGAWVALTLLGVLWALATPIAAAPDEPAHLIKAASVVRGELLGEPTSRGEEVRVPRYIAETGGETCFAFDSSTDAGCVREDESGDDTDLVSAITSAGRYNPLYYALVGWPSLILTGDSGILAMRAASSLITALFGALAIAQMARWRRPELAMLGAAATVTPMVAFLGGTVNPNGLEVTSTWAAAAASLSLVLPGSRRRGEEALIVAVSAAVAINLRGLSPLWVAIAVLTPLILASRQELGKLLRSRSVRVAVVAILGALGLAVGWTLTSGSLTAALGQTEADLIVPGTGAPASTGFLRTLEGSFDLGLGMIGVFGWLDTPAPTVVFFLWSAGIGGLAIAAFGLLRGRRLLLAIGLVSAVFLMPALVQAAYIGGGGFIWQGRYTLPLYATAVAGLTAMLCERTVREPGLGGHRIVGILWAMWGAAHVLSFVGALRRYAVGSDGAWGAFLTSPGWSPSIPIPLLIGLVIAVVASAANLGLRSGRLADRSPSPPTEDHAVPRPSG